MAAMTGASGVRSWLQNQHLTWLTPKRLRAATIALFAVAMLVSTVGLNGSTKSPKQPVAQHAPAEAK